jgi:electron transport complex protein RnfG
VRLVTSFVVGLVAVLVLGHVDGRTSDKAADSKSTADDLARRSVLPEAAYGVFVPATAKGFTYEKAYADCDTSGLVGYTFRAIGRGYAGNIETIAGVDLAGKLTGIKIISHKETAGMGSKIAEIRPAKSVLDALKPAPATFVPRKIAVDLGGAWKGVVQIKNAELTAEVEKALTAGDTARVVTALPEAMTTVGQDAWPENRDLVYTIAGAVVKRLRDDALPWWQVQFLGKRGADLVVSKAKSDTTVQAITGATVSSRAVTESIKNGIVQLEQAVGGFKVGNE